MVEIKISELLTLLLLIQAGFIPYFSISVVLKRQLLHSFRILQQDVNIYKVNNYAYLCNHRVSWDWLRETKV